MRISGMFHGIVLCCLFSIQTVACHGKMVSDPSPVQKDDRQRYEAVLKQLMAEVMAEHEVTGMAMAIRFADGSILDHAAGFADRSTGELLTVDHHFRVGSTTKTITATAILLLCQEGLLGLDDTVAFLLPEVREFGSTGLLNDSGITVRMLLQHTSGLADYVGGEFAGEDFGDIMMREPLRLWDPRDLVSISSNMGGVDTPGETFEYSNTNYILLGMLIEKFSGISYDRFVQEKILNPLALSETRVPRSSKMMIPYAHGYLEKDLDNKLYDYSDQHPSGVWAAGNVISTPGDLLRWLEALVQGSLLQPEFKAEQLDIRDFPEVHLGYGLGVASFGGPLGHNGTVMGYQTWMTAYKGASFVIYNNCHYLSKNVHVSNILFDRIRKLLFDE